MFRIILVVAVIAGGLYKLWDASRARPLEPTLSLKFEPVALRPQDRPGPVMNGGMPPWNENEAIFQNSRKLSRKSVQQILDQPWGNFCQPKGHRQLADVVTNYFRNRMMEERKYAERWGTTGRDYIAKEWSTADDQRIERLVREHYQRGYLDLRDLKPDVVERLSSLLKDARVTGQPCGT